MNICSFYYNIYTKHGVYVCVHGNHELVSKSKYQHCVRYSCVTQSHRIAPPAVKLSVQGVTTWFINLDRPINDQNAKKVHPAEPNNFFFFFYLLINDQEKFIILKELFLFLLLYG